LLRAMAKSHVKTCDFSKVLGQGTVVGEAQDKAVDPHAMPYVEHVHRVPVAGSDGPYQSCV
jgi:hypothetical protein